MNTTTIVKYALAHALGAAAYILFVAFVMLRAISQIAPPPVSGALGIATFLLVFVISAAVMGLVLFARPVIWFLNGKKQEGLALALSTIGFLIVIAVIIFFIIISQAESGIPVGIDGIGTSPQPSADELRQ